MRGAVVTIKKVVIPLTNEFEALSTDELYLLHLEVVAVLREKLAAEKNALEGRLKQLQPPESRRPNPK